MNGNDILGNGDICEKNKTPEVCWQMNYLLVTSFLQYCKKRIHRYSRECKIEVRR